MSISYQSLDDRVQFQELKFRTLIIKKPDTQLATTWTSGASGSLVLDVKQPVDSVTQNAPLLLVYSNRRCIAC
jgi:hypothetical protein